jgi:hypothetical protein
MSRRSYHRPGLGLGERALSLADARYGCVAGRFGFVRGLGVPSLVIEFVGECQEYTIGAMPTRSRDGSQPSVQIGGLFEMLRF